MKGQSFLLKSQNLLSKAAVTNYQLEYAYIRPRHRWGISIPDSSLTWTIAVDSILPSCLFALLSLCTLLLHTEQPELIHYTFCVCFRPYNPPHFAQNSTVVLHNSQDLGCQGPGRSNQPQLSFQLCFLFPTFFLAYPLRSNPPSWQSSKSLTFPHLGLLIGCSLRLKHHISVDILRLASHSGFAQLSSF